MLLFNPPGTIKRSYGEQPLHDMKSAELIAYAMPGLMAATLIGVIAGIVSGMIFAIRADTSIVAPILGAVVGVAIGAVSGIVGAIIVGFLAHPILRFFVNLFKGESDGRSRTNYM